MINREGEQEGTYCANDRLIALMLLETRLAGCFDWSDSSRIGGSFAGLSSALRYQRLWLSRRKKIFCCLPNYSDISDINNYYTSQSSRFHFGCAFFMRFLSRIGSRKFFNRPIKVDLTA